MYIYKPPRPLEIRLTDDTGFTLRETVANHMATNLNRSGAERGNAEQQSFGLLAEMVIRNRLGLPEINPENHPLGYDILLPSGVKVDVKCRGGVLPFKENYESDDGIAREAKHNFFARQLYDSRLDADIYLMTHLETPTNRILPGTRRQRKWVLYVCGWVSKERVAREGVFLPRGSLTEQGRTWFTYRGHEIEFYNRNLNGLAEIADLLDIETIDVENDSTKNGELNVTSVDTIRIVYDLIGRGVLTNEHLRYLQDAINLDRNVKPILHPNQYFHVLTWLHQRNKITLREVEKARAILQTETFEGI